MMKLRPDPRVREWLDRQEPQSLCLSATSWSELLAGIEIMPTGRRKQGFALVLREFRARVLADKLLLFDEAATEAYVVLVNRARSKGYKIAIADGQIAAVAKVHGYTVATRDTQPFLAADVDVINPWEAE